MGSPTYENDKDLKQLIYTEITDEKLLDFFFKKGGTVNITNLSFLVNHYGKKNITQNLVNLETAGLICYIKHPLAKVTLKARADRIYKSPKWMFFLIVIGVILSAIALLR